MPIACAWFSVSVGAEPPAVFWAETDMQAQSDSARQIVTNPEVGLFKNCFICAAPYFCGRKVRRTFGPYDCTPFPDPCVHVMNGSIGAFRTGRSPRSVHNRRRCCRWPVHAHHQGEFPFRCGRSEEHTSEL